MSCSELNGIVSAASGLWHQRTKPRPLGVGSFITSFIHMIDEIYYYVLEDCREISRHKIREIIAQGDMIAGLDALKKAVNG